MTNFNEFINKDYFRVNNPDHPFVYSGPDILLSDAKSLTALFIPSPEELGSSNKLLLRLINSKIGYPANTIMTLVLDHNKEFKNTDRVERDFFDLVIEPSDLKRLKSILKETKSISYFKDFKHTQKQLFDRQARVQNSNLVYAEKVKFDKDKVEPFINKEKIQYFNYLEDRFEKVRSNIYAFENTLIGFKNLSKKPDLEELAPYYDFVLRSELFMKDKIPFFKKRDDAKCLSLNELPTSRFDPMKPMRLASLFGWLIGNINSEKDLEFRLNSYERSKK